LPIIRSLLQIEGHTKITGSELEALRTEFRSEMLSSESAYNALAKQLGETFSKAKPVLPEFSRPLLVTALLNLVTRNALLISSDEEWKTVK
jgi:hypothetical protein